MDSQTTPNNVYCTLVMISDDYVPGALALAESHRAVGSKHPIWCMVSGISADAKAALRKSFDRVIEVPIIEREVVPMKSQKQQNIYGKWIAKSFTKWHVMDPTKFFCDKVLFVDADMIFLENIDKLFDLPAPAATFSSPWATPYVKLGIKNPYGEMPHGAVVSKALIRAAVKNSIVGIGSLVLVHPSVESWNTLIRIIGKQPYGYQRGVSGFDEQALAEVMCSLKAPVHHIHQQYNWMVGKQNWLINGEKPKLYHYYNVKPWQQPRDAWEDLAAWWKHADALVERNPELKRWFEIKIKP